VTPKHVVWSRENFLNFVINYGLEEKLVSYVVY